MSKSVVIAITEGAKIGHSTSRFVSFLFAFAFLLLTFHYNH